MITWFDWFDRSIQWT